MKRKKKLELKLKNMLYDMGVGRETVKTAKQNGNLENHKLILAKCPADDMMAVVDSLEKEDSYDDN